MTLIWVLALAGLAVLLAAPAVAVFDRRAGWPLSLLFIAGAVLLGRELPDIFAGQPLTYEMVWAKDFLGPGIDATFALRGDSLSVFFAMLALVIGAVVFIYSASYLHNNAGNLTFYLFMSGFSLAVLLLVLADDVVVLFIAWELVSIGSFLLIARSGSGGEAGSMRTLILTFTGGLTLLAALAMMATQAGSTRLSEILAAPFWFTQPHITTALALLIAASAFTKAAQFPFHFWLPEAMAAATPVSAFLHAAAVVKAGIYVLLRFSTVFYDNPLWHVLLITVGMGTAVMASLFAIQKTDLKKLTAYSTVSHLGWIVATIGVGTPFALAAAVIHTLAHALFKSSLFMLIGVIDHQAGSRDVRRLGVLWNKLPFTFTAVTIGALSMAAVPPMMGFISKEGMLEAFLQAPLPHGALVVLLIAAAVGAVFTFTYSARLVTGAFFDGPRDMSAVKEAPVSLWLPAALPGVLSLPLAFVVTYLDEPVAAIVAAINGTDPQLHLGLWHGITVPLLISTAVMIVGVVGVIIRRRLYATVDPLEFFPVTGNEALQRFILLCAKWGKSCARMADSYSPSRHLLYPLLVIVGFGYLLLLTTGVDGVLLPPKITGIDRPLDMLPLVIVAISVVGLVRATSRVYAVVLLGTAGVGVTLQILMLGAPDVALTQFLVEILVVVIMMMVIRQQPSVFHGTSARRQTYAAALALAVGGITFAAVWGLIGRHPRPEIATWYLTQGPDITGGDNVVNTILVEFRALDTMGELTVLGMAGVVIAAVIASIPRHPFARGTHPIPLLNPQANAVPLTQLARFVQPLLWVISVIVFYRGHNAPGGGFIAALIAGAAIMLSYVKAGTDKPVVKPHTPYVLTGLGILIALGDGFLGLVAGDSFLYALHVHALGQHFSSAMIFDLGVYLAVLGMVTLGINGLGGYLRPGNDKPLHPHARGGAQNTGAAATEENRQVKTKRDEDDHHLQASAPVVNQETSRP
ncbi:DUF4040 family protein [Corynebacterium choanae]|uniref:Na(+)/H(+) antiporter subunit A n=1 Tax=Corynebacterium choanae TaxID=1862358 RepID=A0A3G6J9Y6_9CORY|nr:DUF4040 family protein [Corynebacterium choanae]AZA14583.1 Na(+)/H(+) antiporter subunit A [Corynebacterium choanae]